ncbi:hypothetical protein SAMD00019534_089960 [Acytostelium subglobosum LB1]|uniref:hypothetical protein n=1 Tax=Acytostelium subglobosum LB1 TaxID=1410327 RepID=UPI000644BD3E|nr:hypothetical protein SAMD00019534_089960 [Acytostelium subglobosum LB1]GAM25821.1 hypothetical protein SAMD00019534_089960 [Acytostelium subglobosum LB1]|eukprot:XP_012751339.1 hypothetical protein SAMD00019534_089960 [Acytostelium subglobosum LB1]
MYYQQTSIQIKILDDDVTTSSISNNEEVVGSDQQDKVNKTSQVCSICSKQFSLYSCPRCFIGYCSSECFKQHNARCTTQFYEQQLQDGLRTMNKVDPKDSLALLKRMKHIYEREDEAFDRLTRDDNDDFEDDEDDDDEDGDDELVDISSLKLDEMTEEQLLSLLTEDEIKEFRQSIIDGTIADKLEQWTPWWTQSITTPKIQELDATTTSTNSTIPTTSTIPALRTIFPGTPSPMLYHHLVDIIYCYCFAMRRFNGEWGSASFKPNANDSGLSDELETMIDECNVILELSTVLRRTSVKAPPMDSLDTVLSRVLANTHSFKHLDVATDDVYFSMFILEDVSQLLKHRGRVLAALSHLHRHLSSIDHGLGARATDDVDQSFKQSIRFATQKLWFFMAWCNEQPDEPFNMQSICVQQYFNRQRRIHTRDGAPSTSRS